LNLSLIENIPIILKSDQSDAAAKPKMVRTAVVFRGAAQQMPCVASGEKQLKLAFSAPFFGSFGFAELENV
jgi:hypothetical protein